MRTGVYDPKTFFLHAALLGQGFPHCPIFPTAASRRSLGRVSVPMWPITLSGRLLIIDLVGRYLTNYLIRREPTLYRISPLTPSPCGVVVLCGIRTPFGILSPCRGQVAHALLTRSPLDYTTSIRRLPSCSPVRLACVRHAASVRPEPGSNSSVSSCFFIFSGLPAGARLLSESAVSFFAFRFLYRFQGSALCSREPAQI